MLTLLRHKRLLWPTVMTLAGVLLGLSLGMWQLQRRTWKAGLIQRIESRAKALPVTLDQAMQVWAETRDVEYLHVRLTGRFHHDKERFLQAVEKGVAGWNVITPLETERATIVLVNRGFVPDRLRRPELRAAGLIPGTVDVEGLVRLPPARKPAFVPDNDLVRNEWYWLDFSRLFGSMFGNTERPYAPFFVDAAPSHVAAPPAGGATRLELPNRHLEYAVTWFALAATLLAVFVVYARA